jgi:hypothetical protein
LVLDSVPRLKAAVDKLTALPLNSPLAFQVLPGAIDAAMMQFGQDVLTGSKKPADVGSVMNPIQKQYIESRK